MAEKCEGVGRSEVGTPQRELFREVDIESAAELLDEISPRRGRLWAEANVPSIPLHGERWIFRGQRDADWGLVPNSLRRGFLKWVRNPNDHSPLSQYESLERTSTQEQLGLEQGLVNRFVIGVDRQGLAVPGDSAELRDYYKEGDLPLERFPPEARRPTFALAQHYGIPTRLLDWSYNAKIAAYFACVDIAERQATGGKSTSERFSVWALSQDFVQRFATDWEPKISIVTVPTVSNPNLHAQQGLFTLVEYRERPPGLRDDVAVLDHLPTVDELIRDPNASPRLGWEGSVPPLWKFSVPVREAGVLLKHLAHEDVTGGTVYHGHKAVVEAIREQYWYQ